MPELWVGGDVALKVLMNLRDRGEVLLGPSASFGSSGLVLLVGVWSELILNG